MNRTIHLHIKRYRSQWGPVILDKDLGDALLQKAADMGLSTPSPGKLPTDLRAPANHPGWPIVFGELEKLGWSPYHGYVPPELKATHYQIRTLVEYDKAYMDTAPLLYLPAHWALWPLTSFVRRNGKRWVGHSRAGVGKYTKQGWGQTHGSVDGMYNYFVHPKVRAHFDKAGLRLHYHPLEWDEPQRAKGEFWEIDTEHVMPPCLNPIISWEDGTRVYEDAGCEPEELRFRRGEVAEMGDFDAAWTREDIGNPNDPRDGGRRLVVTQRFRQVCQDYKLKSVSFFPVRLVD